MNEARVDAHLDGDTVQVALAGDVDLSNAHLVRAELDAAIPNHVVGVDLDLGAVTYIDSSGLQVLFALSVQLRRLQIELLITAPPRSPARHAIEMAGMTSIARIAP
ncbi:MAG: STAS domain-containing protein [Acidimicrobiales bacterium]|nr:STAS domain-containing protein [Acidimicrobiales bacterium]